MIYAARFGFSHILACLTQINERPSPNRFLIADNQDHNNDAVLFAFPEAVLMGLSEGEFCVLSSA